LTSSDFLWQICALSGTWDASYESVELDKFQEAFADFEEDDVDQGVDETSDVPKPQLEAERLTSYLRETANEMDRYPVKDMLPFKEDDEFESAEGEDEEEEDEDIIQKEEGDAGMSILSGIGMSSSVHVLTPLGLVYILIPTHDLAWASCLMV